MYSNLKLEIWRSGVRQNQLARELKVDETLLSRVINGFRQPSPELRSSLSKLLGKPESWLFEPTPEPRVASLRKTQKSDS